MTDKKKKTIEVVGKTREEAIKKALDKLQATEGEVTIKVLKEEQKGLFGMEGREQAKIRVTLNEKS